MAKTITAHIGQTVTREDVAAVKTELEGKTLAATSRVFDVAVPASGWVEGTDSWNGIAASFYNTVSVPGMTEDTDPAVIQFLSGDYSACCTWRYLNTHDGSVIFWSDRKPTADFSVRIIEVK